MSLFFSKEPSVQGWRHGRITEKLARAAPTEAVTVVKRDITCIIHLFHHGGLEGSKCYKFLARVPPRDFLSSPLSVSNFSSTLKAWTLHVSVRVTGWTRLQISSRQVDMRGNKGITSNQLHLSQFRSSTSWLPLIFYFVPALTPVSLIFSLI